MELQTVNTEKRAEFNRVSSRLNDLQVKAIRLAAEPAVIFGKNSLR